MKRSSLIPLLLMLAVAYACVAMSPRAKLVSTHSSIQTTLLTIDDLERVLCFGTVTLPSDPTKCNTEAAKLAKLTDARHQAIHKALAKGFAAQVAISKVIAVWQPGQPVDFSVAIAAAAEAGEQLSLLDPRIPDVSRLLREFATLVDNLQKLKDNFGGSDAD